MGHQDREKRSQTPLPHVHKWAVPAASVNGQRTERSNKEPRSLLVDELPVGVCYVLSGDGAQAFRELPVAVSQESPKQHRSRM
jgi:hypothetical protein